MVMYSEIEQNLICFCMIYKKENNNRRSSNSILSVLLLN